MTFTCPHQPQFSLLLERDDPSTPNGQRFQRKSQVPHTGETLDPKFNFPGRVGLRSTARPRRLSLHGHYQPYTKPWSSMALATFRKPPMFAPFTRLPGVPYFSAVSKQFWWMAIMILCRRSSTSSRVQLSRALFWAISRPDVATPPALAALAGPYRIFASRNILVASSVDGMFAPSATSLHPFFSRLAASFAVISFCVALGKAQSPFTFHSGL